MPNGVNTSRPAWKDLLVLLAVLAVVLGALFSKSFKPEMVLFSNDAPLGLVNAESGQQASTVKGLFTGYWQDLNWLGIEQPSVLPGLSFGMYLLFGDPVTNAKWYAPLALFFLGFCAWFFFRQLGFRNGVCIIGGLAAALNMDTFSHATWGLPSRALTQASIFLAFAALVSAQVRFFWVKAVLAGMAVGFAVMEGFDVGAIYSLYVAAFAMFLVWIQPGSVGMRLGKGVALVAVVAVCAGWLAAHALNTLIGTQIKGVGVSQQEEKTPEQKWTFATQWSLPKAETLRVMIPGLFGYRMDTEEGGRYWGAVGQTPGVPYDRHSGAGEYTGVIVLLLGAWAIASAFRKQNNPFTPIERKIVIFWAVAAFISILFAWGRHAPFYQIVYALPYFSTIRNPIKFMHMFQLAFIILAAFGCEALCRQYLTQAVQVKKGLGDQVRLWFKTGPVFDRRWAYAVVAFGAASFLGWLVFGSMNKEMTQYLTTAGLAQFFGPAEIPRVLSFINKEIGLYLLFFFISAAVLIGLLSGVFAGARARFALVIIGAVLVVDMARANKPWIIYYDYNAQYTSNPVIETLRKDVRERRVTMRYSPFHPHLSDQRAPWFPNLASSWLQSYFQYYNIPALDIIQMPRMPQLDESFLKGMLAGVTNNPYAAFARLWELTSTRTLMAQSGMAELFNQQVNPGKTNFQTTAAYQLGNPGEPALTIVEYASALPRVNFFPSWEVVDDEKALGLLRDSAFDLRSRVLLAEAPTGASAPATNNPSGSARYGNYTPKEFEVITESTAPGIVMVTDKFSPNWKVWVDGAPAQLLRCNHIMRGVYVPAGNHKIEFKFRPPVNTLYVTLAAMGVGLALCAFVAVAGKRERKEVPST